MVLSGWLGSVTGGRLRRKLDILRGPVPRAPRQGTAPTIRAVRKALEDAPELQALALTVVGVSPGVVELRGWVATRLERARAVRAIRALPEIDTVHNRILVRGEDDATSTDPTDDPIDQTA
jgi:osmotically-inducible protein OsmY